MLEVAKAVLNHVSCLVKVLVLKSFVCALAFRQYDRRLASPGRFFKYSFVNVMPFVWQERFCTDIWEKCIGPVQITGLATVQMEPRRVAQGLNSRVDFVTQPAFASYDRLVSLPDQIMSGIATWPRSFFNLPAPC